MGTHASLANLVEQWCSEATSRWGGDWSKIAAHIAACYAALDAPQRQALEAEAAITLANLKTSTDSIPDRSQ
ncbi:MAG: hypothetical protein WCD42_09120 [Rhizomicrobium sp.]